jgi:hypothetical protein
MVINPIFVALPDLVPLYSAKGQEHVVASLVQLDDATSFQQRS